MSSSLPPIVGMSGFAQSGKDTAGQYLHTMYGYERVAFADAVRNSVYMLNPIVSGLTGCRLQEFVDDVGWDRAKVEVEEVRRLLQVMGTEVGRMMFGENVWVDIAARKVDELDAPAVITDVRFANEADFIRSRGGIVIRVDRPGVGALNTHASEALTFEPDYALMNVGTIQDLYDDIDSLISYLV